jgi:type I restriction-modification system DNA methylase subunit
MSKKEALKKISELVKNYKENEKEFLAKDYKENWVEIHFIIPFFKALGWNFDEGRSYLREVFTQDSLLVVKTKRAPDYGFSLPGSDRRLFYVEAKTPAEKLKTEHDPAYQLRRYGRSGETAVSILFNFKEFAVYDCTQKQTKSSDAKFARMKYFTCDEYIENFDYIYDTFSREAAHNENFEKYIKDKTKKKGNVSLDKDFVESLNVWRKNLAQSIAKNNHKLTEDDINFAVQLLLDRIIFLRFCEERDVEPYGQLEAVSKHKHTYNHLFDLFGVADQKYNAGIFDFKKDQITEKLNIDDAVIKSVIEDLYPPKSDYAFSIMPVEILGNAYEQFLGNVIRITAGHNVKIEVKEEVRKAGGVYYTPQYIVDYIVENTLGELIKGKNPKEIEKIKIIDPACGSGSFLLGAYKYLINYHIKWYYDQNKKSSKLNDNGTLTTDEKRRILTNNIFGVDLDTNAVEVSKLSLLLKCMEGETASTVKQQIKLHHTRVLPNIDKNIVNGNSLVNHDFFAGTINYNTKELEELKHKLKPFDWKTVFSKAVSENRFDVVIGNPPYLNTKRGFAEEPAMNAYLKGRYTTATGQFDAYALFIEKAIQMTSDKGYWGYIIPKPILTNENMMILRKNILNSGNIKNIGDFGTPFQDANVEAVVICQSKETSKNNLISILINGIQQDKVPQSLFLKTPNLSFILGTNPKIELLLSKIEKNKSTIKELKSIFIRGVEAGKKDQSIHSLLKNKKCKKLLRGEDVSKYSINYNNLYIEVASNDASKFKEDSVYDSKKILIRRVGSELQAALDSDSYWNLNTVYNLQLRNKDYEFVTGVFNSNLIAFWFKKRFVFDDKLFPYARISQLETIPIPKTDSNNKVYKNNHDSIVNHVIAIQKLNKELLKGGKNSKTDEIIGEARYHQNEIDEIVYKMYELTSEEIKTIKAANAGDRL